MVDSISSSSYRDAWTAAGLSNTASTSETGQVWNAVFTDESNTGVTVDDFLSLMVAQLTNQDFMNPVDDTQYVTQLAQFSTMSQMQELATYMKTNYTMSLVGKNVTAAKLSVSGELQKETGMVEKISLVNNEYTLYVNGKQFSLSQIMEINASTSSSGTGSSASSSADLSNGIDTQEDLVALLGRTVTVTQWDEENKGEELTGIVEKISDEGETMQVFVEDVWYPVKNILKVDGEVLWS